MRQVGRGGAWQPGIVQHGKRPRQPPRRVEPRIVVGRVADPSHGPAVVEQVGQQRLLHRHDLLHQQQASDPILGGGADKGPTAYPQQSRSRQQPGHHRLPDLLGLDDLGSRSESAVRRQSLASGRTGVGEQLRRPVPPGEQRRLGSRQPRRPCGGGDQVELRLQRLVEVGAIAVAIRRRPVLRGEPADVRRPLEPRADADRQRASVQVLVGMKRQLRPQLGIGRGQGHLARAQHCGSGGHQQRRRQRVTRGTASRCPLHPEPGGLPHRAWAGAGRRAAATTATGEEDAQRSDEDMKRRRGGRLHGGWDGGAGVDDP